MKFRMNRHYTTIAIYAFAVVACSILFFLSLFNLNLIRGWFSWLFRLLRPFIFGFMFAYVLNPVMKLIESQLSAMSKKKRAKWHRPVALLITYVLFFAVVAAFLYIVIPQVIISVTSIINQIPLYIKDAQNALDRLAGTSEIMAQQVGNLLNWLSDVTGRISEYITTLLPYAYNFTMSLTSTIFNLFLGILISVYMLSGKERFSAQSKKLLYFLFSPKTAGRFLRISRQSNDAVSNYISGVVLDSFIIGCICYIGMSIFRMPYAILLSVLAAITNMIPIFGPYFCAIPGSIIILTVSPVKALWFLIFITAMQQFDGNFMAPKIIGKSIGMESFWVMFAVLIGGGLYGVIGMFLGAPAFAVLYSIIKSIVERRLEEKQLPTSTADYGEGKEIKATQEQCDPSGEDS